MNSTISIYFCVFPLSQSTHDLNRDDTCLHRRVFTFYVNQAKVFWTADKRKSPSEETGGGSEVGGRGESPATGGTTTAANKSRRDLMLTVLRSLSQVNGQIWF